jgi:hypothetical protein
MECSVELKRIAIRFTPRPWNHKKDNDSIAQVGENEKNVYKTTNFSIQTRQEFKRYFSPQKA